MYSREGRIFSRTSPDRASIVAPRLQHFMHKATRQLWEQELGVPLLQDLVAYTPEEVTQRQQILRDSGDLTENFDICYVVAQDLTVPRTNAPDDISDILGVGEFIRTGDHDVTVEIHVPHERRQHVATAILHTALLTAKIDQEDVLCMYAAEEHEAGNAFAQALHFEPTGGYVDMRDPTTVAAERVIGIPYEVAQPVLWQRTHEILGERL